MNLNVIIDVLIGCTLIILYACHDVMILCLHYHIPYTSKHSKGKTFAVHQQYALCRGNFRGLQT